MLNSIDADCIKTLRKIGYTWDGVVAAYGRRYSLGRLKYIAKKYA